MRSEKLQLSKRCYLEVTYWSEGKPTFDLCYVEIQQDPWYSDNETSISLEELDVRNIITFLQEHLDNRRAGD